LQETKERIYRITSQALSSIYQSNVVLIPKVIKDEEKVTGFPVSIMLALMTLITLEISSVQAPKPIWYTCLPPHLEQGCGRGRHVSLSKLLLVFVNGVENIAV
jgi:hypothetical protein